MSKTTARIRITADDVSSTNPRVLEDIAKILVQVDEEVKVIDQALNRQQRLTAMKEGFAITTNDKVISPGIKDPKTLDIKAEDLASLSKNYSLINNLFELLDTINSAVAKVRQSFPEESEAAQKMVRDLMNTRTGIEGKLSDAFAYLRDLASGHAPKVYTDFLTKVNKLVERSISYAESQSYLYLFETEGKLAFANYLRLQRATDEAGTYFPDIYIVVSMVVDAAPIYYLTTMVDFVPPSDNLFTKAVNSPRDVAKALHTLLAMDAFDNNIGAAPLPFLVDPNKLSPNNFSASAFIDRVELDDATGSLTFRLKPNIRKSNTELINTISKQLLQDMKDMIAAVRARLQVVVRDLDHRVYISLRLEKEASAPKAHPEDLGAIQERFNLTPEQVKKMLRVVNASTVSKEEAMTLPSGGRVDATAIVACIDSALQTFGPERYMKSLQNALRTMFAIRPEDAPKVCDMALREACLFGQGLTVYAQSRKWHTEAAGTVHTSLQALKASAAVRETAGQNLYETQDEFIDVMKQASKIKEPLAFSHARPLRADSTTVLVNPTNANLVSQALLSMVHNATQLFGVPKTTVARGITTWSWTLMSAGNESCICQIVSDTNDNAKAPIRIVTRAI